MSWKKTLKQEQKLLGAYKRCAGEAPGAVCKFFEQAYQDILSEALTISHDLPIFINSVKKTFQGAQVVYAKNLTPALAYKHGTPYCVEMEIPQLEIQHDKLKQLCDFHGYTLVKNKGDVCLFEPNYPVKINLQDMSIQYLYHITPSKNIPRIKSIGLSPKDTQTSHQHRGSRIYLLYTSSKNSLSLLRHRLAIDKSISPQQMSVLRINTKGLTNLYFDENATSSVADILALFTTINIHPDNITDITQQIPQFNL